jgi:hypothetical protein
MLSAIRTKWEGDIQPDVALPLIDQPVNNSKSEVGVRLIDLYLKHHNPETRNAEHWTLNAQPFSRTPTSKIQVFSNQHQVGGRISTLYRLFHLKAKMFKKQAANVNPGTKNMKFLLQVFSG